jgi:nucleoside-diphosphate-sugar epimerase
LGKIFNNKYKIIVTGGTGFIGKRLLQLLPEYYNKKDVLCLIWDTNLDEEKEAQQYIEKLGFAMKKVDLVSKKGLNNLPKNPRVIFHLAANTHTSESNHRVNDEGTINLYDAFDGLDNKTHIVYASTVALFAGRNDGRSPLNEASPYAATNEYGRTKKRAEEFLIAECNKNKFRLTSPRLTTVYGKNARADSMFPMLKNRVEKKSITTIIDWPGIASFIHVDDCAKMLLELSKQKTTPGIAELFFLYTESFSAGKVTEMMYRAMNKKYHPVVIPKFVWNILRVGKTIAPLTEPVLPSSLYNWVWRFGLLVDNTTWCQTEKVWTKIQKWKYKTLKRSMPELIS